MKNLLCLAGLLALFPLIKEEQRDEGGLGWQLGVWEGTRGDVADGSENAMVITVASILGGAGQTREIEIPLSGGVYRGFSVQVFDPEREVWIRRYINDVHRTFASYEGQVESEGSTWRSVTPGRTREWRLVSEHPEPDRWIRTLSTSKDDGETWNELWVDELALRTH
jgi:hypothetical protein